MPKEQYGSDEVLAALRERWPDSSHAWLYEVRNGVGYGRQERYADALFVSCWPSRGIWCAGVEVKVSRSDWKRELADVGKAAEIQRWCDRWWVAAPEGVVDPAEVPALWGLVTVERSKGALRTKVVKDAPKLEPEPWTMNFTASVLRSASKSQAGVRRLGYDEGYRSGVVPDVQEKLAQAARDATQAEAKLKMKEREVEQARGDVARMRAIVKAFEAASGAAIELNAGYSGERNAAQAGKAFLLAQEILNLPGGFSEKLNRIAAAAAELDVLCGKAGT